MPTTRSSSGSTRNTGAASRGDGASASRAVVGARRQVISQLEDDHKRLKKAYKDFEKMDVDEDPEGVEAIVVQVLDELSLHSALEEELLYPAIHGAVEDDLLDEAEVEHESAHTMIEQLRGMSPGDEKYAARFTVLCEYVMHHVEEEEGEMFPQLERAKDLDWEGLAAAMKERRAELSSEAEARTGDEDEEVVGDEDSPAAAPVKAHAGATASEDGDSENGDEGDGDLDGSNQSDIQEERHAKTKRQPAAPKR